jgi:hypothetical protein
MLLAVLLLHDVRTGGGGYYYFAAPLSYFVGPCMYSSHTPSAILEVLLCTRLPNPPSLLCKRDYGGGTEIHIYSSFRVPRPSAIFQPCG